MVPLVQVLDRFLTNWPEIARFAVVFIWEASQCTLDTTKLSLKKKSIEFIHGLLFKEYLWTHLYFRESRAIVQLNT